MNYRLSSTCLQLKTVLKTGLAAALLLLVVTLVSWTGSANARPVLQMHYNYVSANTQPTIHSEYYIIDVEDVYQFDD